MDGPGGGPRKADHAAAKPAVKGFALLVCDAPCWCGDAFVVFLMVGGGPRFCIC